MIKPATSSLQYLNIGYVVTDTDHKVLIINHAARELLAGAKIIKTLEEVVAYLPEKLQLLDHFKYCSVEHKSCSFREVELGDRKVKLFLSPIFNSGELEGNLITLEDITERVEQERAREQFLSVLVHELRTPLTAIKGNSSIIQDHYATLLDDKDFREIVTDINSGSIYVLQMVNQFLDMSRLEAGRIKFDLKQFEAVAVVKETVEGLQVLARDRDLTLVFPEPEQASIQVVADPNRTKQVITNLIGNALKFTDKGGVTVSLKIRDEELEVSVTDTGAGIPNESQAGMFQKYFQATNNKLANDSSKSSGLGLYVTKLMVEGMRGKILLASSKINEGSTFTFTLPLATPAQIKLMTKQINDAEQDVQHAQVAEHKSISLSAN